MNLFSVLSYYRIRHFVGGWMDLSNQYYIQMEDGRNYVKLYKFHIQANKKLLGANYIKL